MRRKRFPGECHGRVCLDQPDPELSRYLQKCAKQNTVERPSQLNYNDPWADWTKYPLVAWPQTQSNTVVPGLRENLGFPPEKQEPIDYGTQAQTKNVETPHSAQDAQDAGEYLFVEPAEFDSPYPEVSGDSKSSLTEADSFQKENSMTEDAAYEECDPVEKAQSPEEMMEEKREEKKAEKFESAEQKQIPVEGRQAGIKGNNIIVWKGFPQ